MPKTTNTSAGCGRPASRAAARRRGPTAVLIRAFRSGSAMVPRLRFWGGDRGAVSPRSDDSRRLLPAYPWRVPIRRRSRGGQLHRPRRRRRLLATADGIDVEAVCEDLDSLLREVEARQPDVVVTDIRMPPTQTDEGIRLAARLRAERPEIGVVVLSHFAEPEYLLALLDSGSHRRAYLLKERLHDLAPLVAAIEAVPPDDRRSTRRSSSSSSQPRPGWRNRRSPN